MKRRARRQGRDHTVKAKDETFRTLRVSYIRREVFELHVSFSTPAQR
jgi:hypothetical protein